MDEGGPATSLELQEMVAAKGATARRISLTEIKNRIADVRYLIPGEVWSNLKDDHALHRMTLCFVTTFAGYTVVGKSAAMSAANFDQEKGQTFAYEDAVRQLWPLLAFHDLEWRAQRR